MSSESTQTTIEAGPKKYWLSKEDFQTKPTELREYEFGDTVTRQNFNSLLIQSFRISRGRVPVQCGFFLWLKEKTGFDGLKTCKAFEDAGAWEVLTEEEREVFQAQFIEIRGHKTLINRAETHARYDGDEEVAIEILVERGIGDFLISIDSQTEAWSEHSKELNFSGANSIPEFNRLVPAYLKNRSGS